MLPATYSRLVGVDINENMIKYARSCYAQPQSNISFEILDICGNVQDFLKTNERFDHVTSMMCLHLIQDQKKAMENIFSLLKPKGDCLLYFIGESPGQDIYKKMFCNWSEYMEDVDDFISHYYQRVNPTYMLRKYVKNAGFSNCKVTERRSTIVYNDLKLYEGMRNNCSDI